MQKTLLNQIAIKNRTTAASHDYKRFGMELPDLQIIFFAILCKLLDTNEVDVWSVKKQNNNNFQKNEETAVKSCFL